MRATPNAIAALIADSLDRLRVRADQITTQINGNQIAPATSGGPGTLPDLDMIIGGAGTGIADAVAYWLDANTLAAEAQLAVLRGGTGAALVGPGVLHQPVASGPIATLATPEGYIPFGATGGAGLATNARIAYNATLNRLTLSAITDNSVITASNTAVNGTVFEGIASGQFGQGITATATGEDGQGINGSASGINGTGVRASANGTGGTALIAQASGAATTAINATGNVAITGAITTLTTPLGVAQGGLGTSSLTSGGVVLGNGTAPVTVTAAGTANQVLRVGSGGGVFAPGAINLASSAAVSGLLPDANLSANVALRSAANTFSGDLTISKANPLLLFNATSGVGDMRWQRSGVDRWFARLNSDAESGSDAGSSWQLISRTDAGALKATLLHGDRANSRLGILTTTPAVTLDVNGAARVSGGLNVGAITTAPNGVIAMVEQTAPAAPAANGVYLYAQDNGAGKTQLMALFSSGAAHQVAIQP